MTILRQPSTDVIVLRTPLMREWAKQCFDAAQVLNRRGKYWVVTQYGLSTCTLHEVVLVKR